MIIKVYCIRVNYNNYQSGHRINNAPLNRTLNSPTKALTSQYSPLYGSSPTTPSKSYIREAESWSATLHSVEYAPCPTGCPSAHEGSVVVGAPTTAPGGRQWRGNRGICPRRSLASLCSTLDVSNPRTSCTVNNNEYRS